MGAFSFPNVATNIDGSTSRRQPAAGGSVAVPLRIARVMPMAALGLAALGTVIQGLGQGGPAALLPMLAVLVASFLGSLAGFAFSAICGAALFHLIDDPHRVLEIMLLCSLANQAIATWSVRRAFRLDLFLPFLLGGLVGAPLGVVLLLRLPSALILHLVGALMIGLAIQQYAGKPRARANTWRAVDFGCGVIAGVFGGFAASPGFVIALRATMKPWDKLVTRAVLQPSIVAIQLAALVCVALMRPAGGMALLSGTNLAFIPASLIGTSAGLAIFHRMTDRQFVHALNAAVLISGVTLLV